MVEYRCPTDWEKFVEYDRRGEEGSSKTNADEADMANLLEMAGGEIDAAASLFFQHGGVGVGSRNQ